MNQSKKNSLFISILMFSIAFLNFPINLPSLMLNSPQNFRIHSSGEISGEKQWIENSNFSSQNFWFMEVEGDTTDVDGIISGEQANFKIIGEYWTFSNITGIPDNISWTPGKESPISITPDYYNITSIGCEASHIYNEAAPPVGNQSRNNPIIHWNRIITTEHDMRDYEITSVQLSADFNASADENLETPFDLPLLDSGYAAEYDHARFYVLFSDINKLEVYEVAYNQTVDLGRGIHGRTGTGGATYVNNTFMKVDEEDELIFYLNRVLSHNFYDFRITLGIDIYNEDNYPSGELDTWYLLLIKSCNFTFDYEKKIDRFTSISWNQNGDPISSLSEYPVLVQNATLNFKYKTDQILNSSLTPNSENLISDDVNLSIQVYLADDFILDNNITVSIDDVSLDIAYIILEPDDPIEPGPDVSGLVYILIASIGGIVIIFGMYQTHFKYPPLVRKIRKLRKLIKKGKKIKPLLLNNREELIKSNLQDKLKLVVSEQSDSKPLGKTGELVNNKIKFQNPKEKLQKEEGKNE
ncbi:MAG: hypothetical protein ACW98X_17050 [Promethearchaeota archaeon]|jgi:hypothetical protein